MEKLSENDTESGEFSQQEADRLSSSTLGNDSKIFIDPLNLNSGNEITSSEFQDVSPSEGSVITPDSSLMGSLSLGDDEFGLCTRDLIVRVDNPEKHSSTLDSYVTFRITTKTTRSDFDDCEYSVRRRYNDFIWLREKLEEEYPSCIIPPLPEKHSMQRFQRFNSEFLKTRMVGLNKFLNRVGDHSLLSHSENLKVFLTFKVWEFAAQKKQNVGLMGRVSGTFHSLATTYLMKNRCEEFELLNEYTQKLSEKLGNLERIGQRIQKEQLEYNSELHEFHPIFTLWSNSEHQLSGALDTIATAIQESAEAQKVVTDAYDLEFAQPLHENILYTEAVKEALKRRDALQIEYELTLEDLQKRRQEREQLLTGPQGYSIGALWGKTSEEIKAEKEQKLNRVIEELLRQVDENNHRHQKANSELQREIESWQDAKRQELKQLFVGMANRQVQYYEKCLGAWEATIPSIKNITTSHGSGNESPENPL